MSTDLDQLRFKGERRGIERLRWLEGDHEFANGHKAPRLAVFSEREVNVQIALALIEELHDALDILKPLPPGMTRYAASGRQGKV